MGHTVIYVDSGSTDGSVELARAKGVEVVQLDMSQPFTMARGRKRGFARLKENRPRASASSSSLTATARSSPAGWIVPWRRSRPPRVAAVSGRRRERFPDRSIYNRIADIEWDAPTGEVKVLRR